MTVYLLPGLGADHRLFDRLILPEYQLKHLDWKPFGDARSLEQYAKVMAEEIDTSQKFALLGVSMGGMVAMEISKLCKPEKTILVSSIKVRSELPRRLKLLRMLRLDKLFSGQFFKWLVLRTRFVFGPEEDAGGKLFETMLKETSSRHIKLGLSAILSWKNAEVGDNVVHIHGTQDYALPGRNLDTDHLIEGGTHLMVFNRAEEISTLVRRILEEKQ